MDAVWLPLLVFAFVTAANSFFVMAEFSLVTVDRALIAQQSEAGDRRAQSVLGALKKLSFQLSGAQLGITIASLLTGYIAQPAIAETIDLLFGGLLGRYSSSVASVLALVLATLVSMLFGELIPKNAAIARPMPIALWSASALRAFSATFALPIKGLNGSANFIVRRMGIEPSEELAQARSPEELGLLAALSARAGALEPATAQLVQRTLRFSGKRADEAMTPRVEVEALPADATVEDLLLLAAETGHSRFPLYEETLDQITGVVTVADALAVDVHERVSILAMTIARSPVQVPDSLLLNDVLSRLRTSSAELAVVVDEYGGTDGIVTVEDLAEELVGEIEDEFDHEAMSTTSAEFLAIPAAFVDVNGSSHADDVLEQVGFHLPDGPYETLAGFVLSILGHLPSVGEEVTYRNWRFEAVGVENRRLTVIRVYPSEQDAESSDEG